MFAIESTEYKHAENFTHKMEADDVRCWWNATELLSLIRLFIYTHLFLESHPWLTIYLLRSFNIDSIYLFAQYLFHIHPFGYLFADCAIHFKLSILFCFIYFVCWCVFFLMLSISNVWMGTHKKTRSMHFVASTFSQFPPSFLNLFS